jgi:hypothetical protein
VLIKPGQIINPSIAANPLNRNLRVDYTLKFTPMNTIPAKGKIVYTFPTGYALDSVITLFAILGLPSHLWSQPERSHSNNLFGFRVSHHHHGFRAFHIVGNRDQNLCN